MNWLKIIQNAIDDIDSNLCDDISADIMAEKYHVSSYYFQKMFSTMCETTVSEYIRNRRLSQAAFEITNSNDTVLDIALKYGFDSHEGFTKAFQRFHGCTPSMIQKGKASPEFTPKIDLLKNYQEVS